MSDFPAFFEIQMSLGYGIAPSRRKFAMVRIQRLLREGGRAAEAVGLYHAARNVWMTSEVFGQ